MTLVTLRGYASTATMAATAYTGDSPLFVIDYLLRLLRVLVLFSLWRIILHGRGAVDGTTLDALLTYTLIAEVFADQFACRTELDTSLWEGSVAVRFLQPVNIVGQYTADMVGRWAFTACTFSVPLLLLAPLLGVHRAPASLSAGVAFVVSLLLGISVGLAMEFVFGSLLVALEQPVWLIRNLRVAVGALLSGMLVPLAILPWGIGAVFAWLPFAAIASTPLRIYTGTGNPVPLMLLQLVWAALLWPLAGWMWATTREKLVGYGG